MAGNREKRLPLAGKLAHHDCLFQGIDHLREVDARLDQEAAHQFSAQTNSANLDADENVSSLVVDVDDVVCL